MQNKYFQYLKSVIFNLDVKISAEKLFTMNIFIVGPMGSGKSTVGKIISDELFLNFFDTDDEIEARTGASIDWIFDLEGENGFRKRESEMLEEMVKKNSIVLSVPSILSKFIDANLPAAKETAQRSFSLTA